MTSTSRVRLDRFRTVDEVEAIAIAAISRPRTVADIERDILRAHAGNIHDERRIRELWAIRRAVQKRHGMQRENACICKGERQFYIIRSTVGFLRRRRVVLAGLRAERDAIETGEPTC